MKKILTIVCLLVSGLMLCYSPLNAGRFMIAYNEPDITDTIPNTCAIVDTTALYVRMEQFNSQPIRTIEIDNSAGLQRVDYQMSIRFVRSLSSPEGMSSQDGAYAGLLNPSTEEVDSVVHVIQHENEAYLSYAYGLQDKYKPMTLATKFKAGASGFNATSISTWFIGDYKSEGVIQVELRAGGTSIDDAVPLATGALLFSIPAGLENGRMYSIPLSKPASIYPDEDFYVIVTYPSGQSRPQGCAMNQSIRTAAGRYLLKSGDKWEDLQKKQGMSNCGWLVKVGGEIDNNIAWLVPRGSASGSVYARSKTTLSLMFRGPRELKGIRYAEVTVTVSDSCRKQTIVPVTLHVDEAPVFLNAPKKVIIPEKTVQTFEIEIFDSENSSFTLEPVMGAKVASHKFSGRKLTLTVAPLKGDAGNYNVRFKVTDSHNDSRYLDIPIFVTVLEQLIDPAGFAISYTGGGETYSIPDLFRYVNEGGLSIIITVRDENMIKLERPDTQTIILIPNELGSTFIDFAFMDDEGNVYMFSVPATVGPCEDPSRIIVQKWNNILLINNAAGLYSNEGYQWYKNKEPIPEATAQYYSAGNNANDLLDFTASYFVRLVTVAGDTVYSCPQIPVRQIIATTKVYPNPVSKGEVLTIETGYVADDQEESFVQLFDSSGRIVQTSRFKGTAGAIRIDHINSGYYLLKVSGNDKTTTLSVFVK